MAQQQNYHGYLGYQWARRIAESRFLRGKNVRFPRMVEAYYILFLTGTVLGRAQSTRSTQLAELFAEPGRSADVARSFQEIGEAGAAEIPSISSSTLFELAMTQLGIPFGVEGGIEEILQLGDKWVPFEDAARELGNAVVLGVSLGVARPDLVEQLWKAKETPDEETLLIRQELGKHGLPEEREPFPLEELEQQALLELAVFVRAYYPSLVAALDLPMPGAE